MNSPFFEWESAGDPRRDWPTSNVRLPRTTLAGGWKWSSQGHGSCHCNGTTSACARIIHYVMVDCEVAFSSFSEERLPASNMNVTLHSLNCRYKKRPPYAGGLSSEWEPGNVLLSHGETPNYHRR